MRDDAISLLDAILGDITGKPPSTTGKHAPRFDVTSVVGWIFSEDAASEVIRQDHPTKNKRPLAYLRAYLAICGDKIPAAGIIFTDGSAIYLDKGVMKSLLLGDQITLRKGLFELTTLGREALRLSFVD